MRKHLPGAVRVLADLLRSGHRAYIHCTAGMGRSPLIVMAYLVVVEGWVPDDAMEMLRRQRRCIAHDWDSYFACRRELSERYRQQIERRAWELYESGTYSDLDADWRHAEAEILRSAILEEGAITV